MGRKEARKKIRKGGKEGKGVIHEWELSRAFQYWDVLLVIVINKTCCVLPCVILLGHHASPGSLNPPSHVEAFPHLRGPALPPRIPCIRSGLEEVD